jgi:photosystem II stability/assembly factor-like uncharacterized protein
MMHEVAVILAALMAATSAHIRFAPIPADFRAAAADAGKQYVDGCAFSIDESQLHVIDDGTLLLYGELGAPPGLSRSLLLRSEDGGATWLETMSPVEGSSVLALLLPRPGDLLALVGWVVEGPGELVLYSSADGGRSWMLVSEIEKPHNLDEPMSFSCSSRWRCALWLECPNGDSAAGHVLRTKDGGQTWTVVNVSGQVHVSPRAVTGNAGDGSSWRLVEENESLLVVRTGRREKGRVVATLPRRYEYHGAGLVPCRNVAQ